MSVKLEPKPVSKEIEGIKKAFALKPVDRTGLHCNAFDIREAVNKALFLLQSERMALEKIVLEKKYKEPIRAGILSAFEITGDKDDRVRAGLAYDYITVKCVEQFRSLFSRKIYSHVLAELGVNKIASHGSMYLTGIRMKPFLMKFYEKQAKRQLDITAKVRKTRLEKLERKHNEARKNKQRRNDRQ